MNIGKAIAIFEQLDSDEYTIEEKGLAIHLVLSMETTNSITKQKFKEALAWSWNQLFELKDGGGA